MKLPSDPLLTQQTFLRWVSLGSDSHSSSTERLSALSSLQSFVALPDHVTLFVIPFLDLVWDLFQHCLFRPLAPIPKPQDTAIEDLGVIWNPETDPNWKELEAVYEFMSILISSEALEVKYLKQLLTPEFLREFIALMDSPKQEERKHVQILMHRIYAKVVPRRKLIRHIFEEILQTTIYEDTQFAGISEILELQAVVISGFSIPLRQEHRDFYTQVLLPLYKTADLPCFSPQLDRCICLYTVNDHALVQPLLAYLLRYWPYSDSRKETAFLNTLAGVVLDDWNGEDSCNLVRKLTLRMCRLLLNLYSASIYKALAILTIGGGLRLLESHTETMYPLLVPVLLQQRGSYWHV